MLPKFWSENLKVRVNVWDSVTGRC